MSTWQKRIVIALFLGGLLTLVVAWICALPAIKPNGAVSGFFDRMASPLFAWYEGSADDVPATRCFGNQRVIDLDVYTATPVEIARSTEHQGADEVFYVVRRVKRQTGWPAPALEYVIDHRLDKVPRLRWGWELRQSGYQNDRGMTGGILPMRPLVVGYALNTIFYTIVSFGSLALFNWIRMLRRRRRGLCVDCGYNLLGITSDRCPECGSQVGGERVA